MKSLLLIHDNIVQFLPQKKCVSMWDTNITECQYNYYNFQIPVKTLFKSVPKSEMPEGINWDVLKNYKVMQPFEMLHCFY